jgi:hypothetical protein
MDPHREEELFLTSRKDESVFAELTLDLPRREEAIGAGVSLKFAFEREEKRGEDVKAPPYRIIDHDCMV